MIHKALLTHFNLSMLILAFFSVSCKTPNRALKVGSDVATVTIKLHALSKTENKANLDVSIEKCTSTVRKSKISENDEVEFKVEKFNSNEYCIIKVTDETEVDNNKLEWIENAGLKYRSNNVKVNRNISDKLYGNAILEKTYNYIASPSPSESFSLLLNTVFPQDTIKDNNVITARVSCSPELPYSSKLERTGADEGLFRYSHEINKSTSFKCSELKGFIDGEFSFEATLPAKYSSFTVSPGDVISDDSEKIEVKMINKEVVVSFDNDSPLECGTDEVFDRNARVCVKK